MNPFPVFLPGGIAPRLWLALGAASTALALSGCASLAPDGGDADVQALVAGNALTGAARAQRSPDAASESAVDALLSRPLDAEAAVRIALANSPRMQEAFATLQISDAERVEAATLPNPVFAFGRLTQGSSLELDRALRFNVLSLFTLPWQARWAGQRHEIAKMQAAQSVLLLAADTRRAWVRAVAAQQSVAYLREAKDAADAGAELARRMVAAGNWSALQRTREELVLADAAAQLARAEQAAVASREQLTRLLGLSSVRAGYALPDRLPALPASPPDTRTVETRALNDRLDVRSAQAQSAATADSLGLTRATRIVNAMEIGAVHNTLFGGGGGLDGGRANARATERTTERGFTLDLPIPLFDWGQARNARAEALYLQSVARLRDTGVRAASEAREASAVVGNAYAVARRYQTEVLPLRRKVNDEMVLRYNGMLSSVWELLAETRATAMAVVASIDAQRDFWIADTELQLAMTGTGAGTGAATANIAGATP
ncbi:TolC family protein [soil metagenome]